MATKMYAWLTILAATSSTSVSSRPKASPLALLIGTGDVGGQKTLRSYWRNYFEKTDALIWVVDATDRLRVDGCREELQGLLQEEVRSKLSLQSPWLILAAEAFRRKFAGLCKQDRREWVHD